MPLDLDTLGASKRYTNKKLNEITQMGIDLSSLPDSTVKIISRNKDKIVLHYDTKRKIVYAVDNIEPSTSRTKLYASYNYGTDWAQVYDAVSYGIADFYTLASGYYLMFTTNSRVRRISPDFLTVQQWMGANVIKPISCTLGLAEHNGVIMFAEYGSVLGTVYKIWKSVDDGINWTIALEGTDVRHWHSLQVDPYTGFWWACAGDSDIEARIIVSEDDGTTWNIKGTGSQAVRAVGLAFYADKVIWGMDTAATTPNIMKSDKTVWNPVVIAASPYGCTTLGVYKTVNGLTMGWTRVEDGSTQREIAVLWVTDGETVKVILKFTVDPAYYSGVEQAGFTYATAIDDENRWFGDNRWTTMLGMIGVMLPVTI